MAFVEGIGKILLFLLLTPVWIIGITFKLGLTIPLLLKWNFPLSEVPGPRPAAWTRFWWIKKLYNGRIAQDLVTVDKKYGPIVRIGPNSILISDPDTTRRVLAVGSKFARGPWFDSLRIDPTRKNVVSERDPKKHQQLRSILSAGLSGKDIKMEAVIDEHIREWICKVEAKMVLGDEGEVQLDLSQTLPFLTLDIIAHLCLGESFHCVEKEEDAYGFLAALQTGVVAQQYISSLLEVKNFLFFLGKSSFIRSRIFPNLNNKIGIGRVMKAIHNIVERRLVEREKMHSIKEDMLQMFLSKGLTLDQASSELVIVLASGVGSISYALQGIIRCIVSDRKTYRKLQNEIDSAIGRNTRSSRNLSDTTISKLPYLQACKAEGLRVYPPIFQLREREVPPEGELMHGYCIPGGTSVGLNSFATQLHPVYGSAPEEFHPERWLIEDELQLKEMYRNLDLLFSYGSSKCLGVNIAHMELNKIIFEIFKDFNISFTNPESPWKDRGNFVLSDFQVKITRRNV